ncbi:NAD(P)/FAD-dependent oxidoreductase [Nocardioides sp. AE5]|uniref:flavin-containing monooxygenase n=1 Tax=Nocardioides sp. AE5 TaxID=2962573 RepID=UPI002881A992|nr:NAD(P)/FAD-dependent oxidoreductase [Nocardioides sp. AE5]MDT0203788.1 NAD(P)/FAD-dependent oxidoreductase [Nocardioides sp. AE5]
MNHVDHLVIGAGFAGVCAAIKLSEDGEDNFLVIEKDSGVGGTWRANDYPGAACDVPSHLYSFSFAPNPDWSMAFSQQPEIQAYIERVAAEADILDRFRFGVAAQHAHWDEEALHWVVDLSDGTTVTATTLISGSGGLSEPKLPDIDGIDTFAGEVFHSARWNHDVDLGGKRVAVIGTGASAIQIIPELQKVAGHVDVYQRTAPWVIPRNDRRYTGLEKFVFRHVPLLQRLSRTAIYWGRELYVPAFTRNPKLAWPALQLAKANIARGIKDPALRAKVTPDFAIGCKRILISNTYYPALGSANVEVVTDPIAKVTGDAVVTADGVERPIDVLVVATGFHTTEQPIAEHIVGRGGATLADTWRTSGQCAYKGTTVAGFPNLFQIVGPNTGLGHSSMVFMIESQVAYVRDAIRTMRRRGYAAIEPHRDVQVAWNEDLQEKMGPTVWNTGGCASWYLDEHGRNTTLWPGATFTFRRLLSRFDPENYAVVPAHEKEEAIA